MITICSTRYDIYYLNVLNLCNIYDKYQSRFSTRITSSMAISAQNMPVVVSKNSYIDKALEYDDMLTVIDFITTTNYPIDKLYIDKFWATLQEDKLIYVNDELLQWMGFNAKTNYHRKDHFLRLLDNNKISYNCYTNEEYREFLESLFGDSKNNSLYPEIPTYKNSHGIKHILLTTKSFKRTMMCIDTNNGKSVQDYYLALEDLFKFYIDYQMQYKERYVQQQLLLKDKEVQENKELLLLKDKEVQLKDNELKEKDQIIAEKDKSINRIGLLNEEYLSYKKYSEKKEVLYIGSTLDYARQGLFKVSKTKDVTKRTSTHNSSHPIGDEFIVFREVQCNDALSLERYSKHLLKSFRPCDGREFYRIPYDLLMKIIDIVENDFNNSENEVNNIINQFNEMRKNNDEINWTNGLPIEILNDNSSSSSRDITLALNRDSIVLTVPTNNLSEDQKKELFINTINAYKQTLTGRKKPNWNNLHKMLNQALKQYNKSPKLDDYTHEIFPLCSILGLTLTN